MSPEHREAIESVVGYGPGDAYVALWDELVVVKRDSRAAANSLVQPALTGTKRVVMEKGADWLRTLFIETLISILPYERRKLAMIKYQGDGDGELLAVMMHDVTRF
jgi:hypothetical protein